MQHKQFKIPLTVS